MRVLRTIAQGTRDAVPQGAVAILLRCERVQDGSEVWAALEDRAQAPWLFAARHQDLELDDAAATPA